MKRPCLLITIGDVAGIGPEIVAKAWPKLLEAAKPVVLGDVGIMQAALRQVNSRVDLRHVESPQAATPDVDEMPVIQATDRDLTGIRPGVMSAAAGGAAHDFLLKAIDLTLEQKAAGIVTCPLNKEGLNLAGVPFPGHTEILAHRTGAKTHAMLLYDDLLPLAVAHVTLHQSLRTTFQEITTQSILDKIRLLHQILPRLTQRPARIGVMALNPHGGDNGLFGDEEEKIISPAVEASNSEGIDCSGPWPPDSIFMPHNRIRFDGIVAMYHDQGHIPMKLLGGRRAVNITAGLPIIRTSVAHGTAYDIAGHNFADESSLIAAVRVAAQLAGRVRV
ncbi:MAG: 4-hydroxythreonine-4-phosphate dehydrogenase PdxA [Fimbriiglobus sp.]